MSEDECLNEQQYMLHIYYPQVIHIMSCNDLLPVTHSLKKIHPSSTTAPTYSILL